MSNSLVFFNNLPHVVIRETDDWGVRVLDLASPPRRLADSREGSSAPIRTNIDPLHVSSCPSPAELLCDALPETDNWSAMSKRSLARFEANFLAAEDPQRRLDAREVVTLAHQVSLVRHILDNPECRRVLIGDEVGLGKTIVAGLILQELLANNSGLRVLYLAPARLVSNVGREFRRMNLAFREWKAQDGDARLETDPRIIASIHRAVHRNNIDRLLNVPRWDVIVVDECHHLSDWAIGGGDPVRKYRLVRDLVETQSRDAYLLLLSGTPHQAHAARFENLLRLLQARGENLAAVRGRVIYRTKEDVRDWDGNPLFPQRQVNPPLLLDLSPEHQQWLNSIYDFFRPQSHAESDARSRVAGWKCAQALQWATSSPNAGLGYLVRQALRAGWDLERGPMREAIAAMRPYRSGSATEPVDQLHQRLLREIGRQVEADDMEDIEDFSDLPDEDIDHEMLEELILQGVDLVMSANQTKWDRLWADVIEPADGEKIVLFAQPIETVLSLANWLQNMTGQAPAIIIGGQSEQERDEQVARFRRVDGPQFLISSRAGGEGINLQFARRLVHLDVPWNPMEMEQRVGRVHRFGSRQTILVDTLVVRNSRESHAWTIARERLNQVASNLVAPDRFDTVFARVMCLIPPDELQTVLIRSGSPELEAPEISELAELVDSGFQSWQQFHERFAANQQRIRDQNPGLARWSHLKEFLIRRGDAEPASGVKRTRFVHSEDTVDPLDEDAEVIRLRDDSLCFVGDYEGGLFEVEDSRHVGPLGLNVPGVAEVLSQCSLPRLATGAANLKWSGKGKALRDQIGDDVLVLAFARQAFLVNSVGGIAEIGLQLVAYALTPNGVVELEDDVRGELFDLTEHTTIRVKPIESPLKAVAVEEENRLGEELRRPSEDEIRHGIRFAVWPILAAHIAP